MPVCVHACMLTPLLCQAGHTALAIARSKGYLAIALAAAGDAAQQARLHLYREMEALLRQHGAE